MIEETAEAWAEGGPDRRLPGDGRPRSFRDKLVHGQQKLARWLASSGIDGDAESQRSSERNRRALVSALAGLALRGSSFAVLLLSVPLTLSFLNPVRFGMWMTLASVVALLGATDLGVGNGVLNNVAHAFGQGDRAAARRYLASGLVVLTGIATVFGVLFALTYSMVPWAHLYNVSADPVAASEAGPATAVFVATFLVGLPLGLIGQVRSAFQEGFVQSAFAGLGNMITLAMLLLTTWARASLPVLVLAMTIGPILAAVINLVILLRGKRRWLVPAWADVSIAALRSVMGVGLAFMVLQIAYAVAFSADPLIVAQIIGPVAVADYSVVYRLFSIPAGLAVISMIPLWPAYREALSRSDIRWVRVTLKRSFVIVVAVTVPLAICLAISGPAIVDVWTRGGLAPVFGLYVGFAGLTISYAVANVFSVFLNGAQELRFQICTWVPMAFLNVVASVYLASRIGVAGVAFGSMFAVVAVLIIPAALYVRRLLRNLDQGQSSAQGAMTSGA